ncbi:Multiple antibiotic resistance protein marA [Bhargavaea cecembensis DSE10]|uniref:Multiple antibiotic resistance protein marA n=1 Tax=Bhargavaea cecembensis DSE10 TaxID=1235279 RepID=M7NCV9_9BACL|nr:AraC family transcriptional regulator [Bhargavaea cecembensis]EMR05016.1 Multiple antibiotic resistance protein marA [Bhargavaea cecembensis DSE10]
MKDPGLQYMTNLFMDRVEVLKAYERSEDFYHLEKDLLEAVAQGDRARAKDRLNRIVLMVKDIAGDRWVKDVSNYYIIFAALTARFLMVPKFPPEWAVATNITAMRIVDRKSGTMDITETTNDLVEFFIHVLEGRDKPELPHPIVNDIIHFIDASIEDPITVDQLAKRAGISTSHLSRIFREHAGLTLIDYINMRKIEESQFFLRNTDLKIAEVSDRFSFCNQSYFTRTFKKYTNVTPKQFRERKDIDYFTSFVPGSGEETGT